MLIGAKYNLMIVKTKQRLIKKAAQIVLLFPFSKKY